MNNPTNIAQLIAHFARENGMQYSVIYTCVDGLWNARVECEDGRTCRGGDGVLLQTTGHECINDAFAALDEMSA